MTSVIIYSCFTCLLSARLFMLLLFSCSFIMLFSYLMTIVYIAIILCTLLYARVLLFTHTLTRSFSDDLEFARPDIGRFVSIVQVFDETVHFARSWTLSLLILVFLHFFIPAIIL